MIVIIACYFLMTLPMVALYILLGFKWTQRPRSYLFVRFLLISLAALSIAFPGVELVSSIAPEHVYPAGMFGLASGFVVGFLRAKKYD